MLLARHSGPPDESFWSDYRRALLALEATEGDLRFVATLAVLLAARCQSDSPDDREEQMELIARHFAEADMTVAMSGPFVVTVKFPGQETH
jgi:hypothetical protein